jgi:hypothetical protein
MAGNWPSSPQRGIANGIRLAQIHSKAVQLVARGWHTPRYCQQRLDGPELPQISTADTFQLAQLLCKDAMSMAGNWPSSPQRGVANGIGLAQIHSKAVQLVARGWPTPRQLAQPLCKDAMPMTGN